MTHTTLGEDHCRLAVWSISNQRLQTDFRFDMMYIYNTHPEELANEKILEICDEYKIHRFLKDDRIRIFDYDNNSHKSLGADVLNIIEYATTNFSGCDRILFMKSDCILSKYYFQDISELPDDRYVYFTAPFVCAKRRISNEEIQHYVNRDKFIKSDEITFFTEDRYGQENTDLVHRTDVRITDECIKFFACYVIRDWSCHLISVSLFPLLGVVKQSWGGIGLQNLEPYFCETNRSFVVHKYHGIVSENRSTERWGPVNEWLHS